MVYTQSQEKALAGIKEFIAGDADIFILKGYAGTGKTTILSPILDILRGAEKNVRLMAPTGRAANVLSSKTGENAATIHKSIYMLSATFSNEGSEAEESEIRYFFPIKDREEAAEALVAVIDEASMVSFVPSLSDIFRFGSGNVLRDLLYFFDCKKGAKIVFVGDPAQLPPVGDKHSNALNESYFQDLGYKVMSAELTDVVRQDNESAVFENAGMIRDLLAEEKRNHLEFKIKSGEFECLGEIDIVDAFLKKSPAPEVGSSVLICYSNAQAAMYNRIIRRRYFGPVYDVPQKGDVMIVVGNHYNNNVRAILNGEFVQVLGVSDEVEILSAPVYRKDVEGNKRRNVALQYRDARLRLADGTEVDTKIVDSLLCSEKRDLDYQEVCSVYINFKMRYPALKHSTAEFLKT